MTVTKGSGTVAQRYQTKVPTVQTKITNKTESSVQRMMMMKTRSQPKGNWYSYLQHLSQKNLSSAFNVSVEQKFFRQLVIELFCSMSTLRSRNVSSLAVTVSHRKHLVSLVRMPCKLCIHIRMKRTESRRKQLHKE
jgi:hypothetical protein